MKTNCLHILVNKIIYILSFKELYESFLFFYQIKHYLCDRLLE